MFIAFTIKPKVLLMLLISSLVVIRATWCTFLAQLQKNEKNPPQKTIFQEMELSCSNIKNSYIFFNESLCYILEKWNLLIFPKMEPCTSQPDPKNKKQKNPPRKKFLIFPEMELSGSNITKGNFSYIFSKESFSYIFSNETLRFSKIYIKKIILQETKTQINFLHFLKRKLFLCFEK